MGSLECNFCTLERLKRQAAERHAEVTVGYETDSVTYTTWVVVRFSDEDRPVAHFLELPDHCVC